MAKNGTRFDFASLSSLESSGLNWKNNPATAKLEEGEGLRVIPKPKTDFWRKTFQEPPANRASGHALLYPVPLNLQKWSAEVVFTINPQTLYDQAGLFVYADDQHWLKAGVEVEGGKPRMSCVVTDGESSWNFTKWQTVKDVKVRVLGTMFLRVCECTVEYFDKKDDQWCFLREGQINLTKEGAGVSVGMMCCAPKKEEGSEEGMDVVFKTFILSEQS